MQNYESKTIYVHKPPIYSMYIYNSALKYNNHVSRAHVSSHYVFCLFLEEFVLDDVMIFVNDVF